MLKGWARVPLVLILIGILAPAAWAADYITERVNLSYLGTQSNGGSWAPSLSADGRYIAFHSWATDLVAAGDHNGIYDVYLRDTTQGISYRISDTWNGLQANGESLYPAISADGLSVAFSSVANNLVSGDTNAVSDVFVRDWQANHIERVSVSSTGEQGNNTSSNATISGDGRCVVFRSQATNLIPGGNPYMGVYVRDRPNQTTECASVSSSGALANQSSFGGNVSSDGRYVVFISWASNLVAGDTNGTADVFVRDRQTGTTERASISSTGVQANGTCGGSRPAITPDGRYVVFSSLASNLVTNDTNGTWDVFVRDRVAGTTERVSLSTAGVEGNGNSGADSYVLAVSEEGRYVEFCSAATNLVANDTDATWDTFVRDRQAGTTERVSVSTTGAQPYTPSGYYGLALNHDGTLRIFDSKSHNLVPSDTSTCINTFVRRAVSPGSAPVADFSANPTSGEAPLDVQFTDLSTGSPTSWLWSFGDGTTSTNQGPSHRYTSPGAYTVTLKASNASGDNTKTKTGYLSVQAPPHTVTVTAGATPGTIDSGGTVTLSAAATDNQGHTGLTWSWSDGGAGGTFSPSASVQNPTYVAASNTTGSPRAITFAATATCQWYATWVSGSVQTSVTEQTLASHTLSVTAGANPTSVASRGTTSLSASATDSLGHGIASWSWSDGGAGGSFSPSATAQNPTYTAPANTGSTAKTVTLTVTATCDDAAPISNSGSTKLTVQAPTHTVTVTATATPATIASGGTVTLSAAATDSLGHGGLAWSWSDGGAGGTFSSTTVRNPTYTAPVNATGSPRTITFTVTAICKWFYPWTTATATTSVTENAP